MWAVEGAAIGGLQEPESDRRSGLYLGDKAYQGP